ncbi:hypothetical protein MD484_g2131, partial [Candolleomyces efflorescens]
MPRTRNVSRSQWDAANARRDSRASKENGYDENEKENAGRATRASTRAGSRRTVLGAPSSAVATTTKAKAKGKGKEKPPSKGTLTKTEKLPLQDITKRFLPAPESANRGYPQSEVAEAITHGPSASTLHFSTVGGQSMGAGASRHASTSRAANAYPSSLPPSSPPSASPVVVAPLQPLEENDSPAGLPALPPSPVVPIETLSRRLFAHAEADEERPYDAWDEFDYVVKESDRPSRPVPAPRSSDPFGFLTLERKLKEERENEPDEDGDEEEDEDEEAAGLILVADTSSPRPVRRLPRHLVLNNAWGSEDVPHEAEEEVEEEEEELRSFPPTPHKSRARARHSCAGNPDDHLFSPHPSSCPSSPSPSKPATSSAKRKAAASHIFEEEEEEEEPVGDSSFMSQKIPGKKQARLESDGEETSTRRQLRSRSVHQKAESSKATSAGAERKGRSAKRSEGAGAATKKGRSKAKKRGPNKVEDPDMEEWEHERQVRLDYFHQLEEYEFETENVYVV